MITFWSKEMVSSTLAGFPKRIHKCILRHSIPLVTPLLATPEPWSRRQASAGGKGQQIGGPWLPSSPLLAITHLWQVGAKHRVFGTRTSIQEAINGRWGYSKFWLSLSIYDGNFRIPPIFRSIPNVNPSIFSRWFPSEPCLVPGWPSMRSIGKNLWTFYSAMISFQDYMYIHIIYIYI